jgi:hypothetical protein
MLGLRATTQVLSAFVVAFVAIAPPGMAATPLEVVRDILDEQEARFDIARDRLALEKIADPSLDTAAALKQIDEMAAAIRTLAGPNASSRVKISWLRKYVYDAGPWNSDSAFQYDLTDPLGQVFEHRLLSQFLKTRKGNCVSMPILFVALAERLGLKATIATAPDHAFVKYFDDEGRVFNIETTSGGHPARDAWYQQNTPMSAQALGNGLYMRPLSTREVRALLASVVIEYDIERAHKFQEAWDVAVLLKRYSPHDLAAILTPARVASSMYHDEFLEKYGTVDEIPADKRDRFNYLRSAIVSSTQEAEALGWRISDSPTPARDAAPR